MNYDLFSESYIRHL